MKGYNGGIICYGETGTGKTYTIREIIPQVINQIFDFIDESDSSNQLFKIDVSIIEVFKEQVNDLIDIKNTNLNLRDQKNKILIIDNLTHVGVSSKEQLSKVINKGLSNRNINTPSSKEHNSKSHFIIMITIFNYYRDKNSMKIGKLNIVDLEGSERISKTKMEGEPLEEQKLINKSLIALSRIVQNLSNENDNITYAPYRDSKLTRIISDYFGGNAYTCLILNCSKHEFSTTETRNTLMFGEKCKKIKNRPIINIEKNINQSILLSELFGIEEILASYKNVDKDNKLINDKDINDYIDSDMNQAMDSDTNDKMDRNIKQKSDKKRNKSIEKYKEPIMDKKNGPNQNMEDYSNPNLENELIQIMNNDSNIDRRKIPNLNRIISPNKDKKINKNINKDINPNKDKNINPNKNKNINPNIEEIMAKYKDNDINENIDMHLNKSPDKSRDLNHSINLNKIPNMDKDINQNIELNKMPNNIPNFDRDLNQNMNKNAIPNMDKDINQNMKINMITNMDNDINQNMNRNMIPNFDNDINQNMNRNMIPNIVSDTNQNMNTNMIPISNRDMSQYMDLFINNTMDKNMNNYIDKNINKSMDKNRNKSMEKIPIRNKDWQNKNYPNIVDRPIILRNDYDRLLIEQLKEKIKILENDKIQLINELENMVNLVNNKNRDEVQNNKLNNLQNILNEKEFKEKELINQIDSIKALYEQKINE